MEIFSKQKILIAALWRVSVCPCLHVFSRRTVRSTKISPIHNNISCYNEWFRWLRTQMNKTPPAVRFPNFLSGLSPPPITQTTGRGCPGNNITSQYPKVIIALIYLFRHLTLNPESAASCRIGCSLTTLLWIIWLQISARDIKMFTNSDTEEAWSVRRRECCGLISRSSTFIVSCEKAADTVGLQWHRRERKLKRDQRKKCRSVGGKKPTLTSFLAYACTHANGNTHTHTPHTHTTHTHTHTHLCASTDAHRNVQRLKDTDSPTPNPQPPTPGQKIESRQRLKFFFDKRRSSVLTDHGVRLSFWDEFP